MIKKEEKIRLKIVGGTFRSRNLVVPELSGVRPTQERIRKAVFSALGEKFDGGRALDLFAGSGAYGFEGISRGMSFCVFNDLQKKCTIAIKKSASILGVQDKTAVMSYDFNDALKHLEGQVFDYVFLDPPYKMDVNAGIVQKMEESKMLSPEAVLVLEQEEELVPIRGYELKTYAYSYKRIGIYRKKGEEK